MNIFVLTNFKKIEPCFAGIGKTKNISLRFLPAADIKKIPKIAPPSSLVYADISSYSKTELPKILKFLTGLGDYRYGIIDPQGKAGDIAEFFHNGASDYIGKNEIKKGVDRKRLERIIKFKKIESGQDDGRAIKTNYITTDSDWKNIQSGNEYTFCFMYIELDTLGELRGFGIEMFNRITSTFHKYVEELIKPLNGRIWIWTDSGGVVLFPFNRKNCKAIEAAFRLMINRKLFCAEKINLEVNLSYRIAMHIGNSVYQTSGETGTIVSDSLNSVFHLGQKFASPGNFYLTEEIFQLVPPRLAGLFVPAGEFEGRNIMRLLRIA